MSKARQVLWTGAAAAAVTAAAAAFLLLKEPQPEKEMQPLLFEAEAGVLNGVHAAAELSGYSGDGYVTGFDDDEDSLTVFVEAPEDGLYDMWVGYSSPGGDKYTMLSLDDRQAAEIRLAASGTFTEAYAGKWLLRTGRNEVLISRNWGWYNMDYIKIRKARKRPEHRVERRLVNPDATPETVELFNFLADQYGKHILSGQQTLLDSLKLLHKYGKEPAITGFDLMEYSPSMAEYGTKPDEVSDILMWHNRGGIVTLAWHWNAPTGLLNTPDQPWYRGFYAEASTFDVEQALADPESENYRLLLRDIDAIAVPLKQLQDLRIPILWRPLHEAEGGWFWWGAKGPEPAKQLYRLLYDRLTNVHGLNNLIWIWNSEDPAWYPGDDVVDIVSIDSYPKPGDYSPISHRYENLVQLVQDRKLAAMTENGPIPDPDLLVKTETHWSWFCTWNGDFINDGIQNSEDHIRHVLNHEYVLTLDEVKELRS